jgi:cytoskeletal protein CcmA (bactofilin family)
MANLWNRGKKEEEPTSPRYTSSTPPTQSELSREGIPMSTLPSSRPSTDSFPAAPTPYSTDAYRSGPATIGKAVSIKGQIHSREDLIIDGEVEGSVEALEHKVVVGPNGRVNAGIRAREIVVQGSIRGDVEAGEKIDIRKDAKLVGNIKTARIVIEDMAYFTGSVDIQKGEQPKPVRQPQPAMATAPAAAVPPQSAAAAGPTPVPRPAITDKP